MSKIIVNPTLYITCRLCLEDLGVYQIVPEVKEQIFFCFGINIELFDGLPPLICNSCEKSITQFSELKKKFIQKQQELLTKISRHNGKASVPTPKPVPAPTASVSVPKPVPAPTASVPAPTASVPALTASVPAPKQDSAPPPASTETETPIVNNIEDNVRRSRSGSFAKTPLGQLSETGDNISEKTSWKKEYRKKFQCRLCFLSFSNKKYLKVHLAKHKALKAKYRHVFRKFLQVKIPKVDEIPNLTGSDKRVVLNKNKIIESRRNDHYIVYLNGDENDNPNPFNDPFPIIKSRRNSSESSDIDLSITCKRAKRRRICSSSSNETVILDDKNNGQTKLQPSVPIDDSDDETVPTTTNKEIVLNNIAKGNSKDGAIVKIISDCCMKYENTKSDFSVSDNVGMQIKRKILSLGRKIINSKNFNSNVLLKFLQYKNLDIAWVSRSVMHNNTTESNFVKIQTRKKNDSDKDKIDTNWVDHSPTKDDLQFSYEQCCIGCDTNYVVEPAVSVTPILENTLNKQSNEISVTDMSDSAVLCSLLTNDTKKLLNANPVANPKQLPKKCPTVEKVSPKMTTALEPEICMPIITSTTSLAEIEKPVADVPRIKVKPVSELMSKESLRFLDTNPRVNMCQNQPVTENPSQPVSNIYLIPGNVMTISNNISKVNAATLSPFTNTIVSASGSITEAPKNTAEYVILDTVELPNTKTISPFTNTIVSANGSITEAPKNTAEYVILDTVELPNAKTISPFKYFKSLLQMHNIILLDPNEELSSDFHCLIRFKVRYNQESKGQPLVLGLSLHCRQNVFCMKIKGRTQDDIDMSKITANWQWEILKIYRGEVVKKMLDTATKIGQETLEYTSSFLCLLKSINYLPINS